MYLARFGLRASVAALPDHQLRGIVLRLLDTSYSFRRALQKEIAFADHEEPDTPPTTPTATTHRRGKARRATRSRKSRKHAEGTQRSLTLPHQPLRPESPAPQLDSGADHVYHPGHLEDDAYEFVSRTPNGAAFKVVQKVTMWSCCNEDELSPGCILIAPTFANDHYPSSSRPSSLVERHSSSSSLFEQYRALSSSQSQNWHGASSKLPPLDTSSSVERDTTGLDVYPDSDLESPYSSDLLTPVSYGRDRHSIA